ncbi:MAG: hypothetical protein GY806_11400 [Gammaproteobacteria bacterium]|nr:hypothetical protein [Gammaproteobacteria bacterium]
MNPRLFGISGIAMLTLLASVSVFAYHEISGGPIIVNGQELDSQQGGALIQYYGGIPAGNYWYDRVSGLWGLLGGPSTGQILPNLNLGGDLQAASSGGGTGVFINGREIHIKELDNLQQIYGVVIKGRYWMNAQLIGGFEDGPAIFNLGVAAGSQSSGYNRNTIGGGLMSDGSCTGYLHPGGASVMTGNC